MRNKNKKIIIENKPKVIYHQDTIDRLTEENCKIKAKSERFEITLHEIYQLCENTFYIDDRNAIANIMHIIEETLND